MKEIIKKEHGSITLFVLISMLFMTMFLITIYTLSTNNEIAIRNRNQKLKDKYEKGLNEIDEVYAELKSVKAYDQYGDKIDDFETYWEYDYYIDKLALKVKDKEKLESKIDVNTGELLIQVPYYLIIGDSEGYIESYATYVKDEKGNYIDINGDITTNVSEYVTKGLFQELTVKTLDLRNVIKTDKIKNMASMFLDCSKLNNINLGEDFIISEDTDITNMFKCNVEENMNVNISNLETFDILTNAENHDILGIDDNIIFVNELE